MNKELKEYYDELTYLSSDNNEFIVNKYKKLRDLLERVIRTKITDSSLQMTDLGARINYVASLSNMNRRELNALHTFRLNSNSILNRRKQANLKEFNKDALAVQIAFDRIFNQSTAHLETSKEGKKNDAKLEVEENRSFIQKIRVCFEYLDDKFLYVNSTDSVEPGLIKVAYNVKGINDEFNETIDKLWRFAQLNLLDVKVTEDNIFVPSFIVLEPDYLIDISSLAECFRDYGSHPYNYILNRLTPIENAKALLVGNIANMFLDEFIYSTDEEPDFTKCIRKAFRQYPIELAACQEIKDTGKAKEFIDECKLHFRNIRETVNHTFNDYGYKLDKSDAVLEPSYICEALGVQGRLDYMQRDMSSFIEMKSGKADEYSIKGKVEPKQNNRVQMLLYAAVLHYSMLQSKENIKPYLLYSRYPLLYPARPSWAQIRRIINLRNIIVNTDYGVQLHNSIDYTSELLSEITPDTLNEKGMRGTFWQQFLMPQISRLGYDISNLNDVERKYLYALYNFITKELYTSKSGDVEHDGRTGASSLWRSTLEEKKDSGEILFDLKIDNINIVDSNKEFIHFIVPDYGNSFLPNFRNGDAVIFYQRNNNEDNVTNKMVFKGNIENITNCELIIRLRAAQRNMNLFPKESNFAVEHDIMDTTYRSMYLGLSHFMRAQPLRRSLLLGMRNPEYDKSYVERIKSAKDDFDRVALKAEAANDYFLLVGPPGTGKTSRALKTMVQRFHSQGKDILLMAYTNRAVDEICQSVSTISPKVDFIRVGSELSCDKRYINSLLGVRLESCTNRDDVNKMMSGCRIYIGTVASISSKTELFKLKQFDVAIIDEATQILEPQLVGVLSAKSINEKDAIGKFIMIGDYKQLPAVVLQSSSQSEISDKELNSVGLYNLKDSLFERLYRLELSRGDGNSTDMLCRQGRMNPDVAEFPNREFYEGKLMSVGLPHQIEKFKMPVCFVPARQDKENATGKSNRYEAKIVAKCAVDVYNDLKDKFEIGHSLGIITPYRSQIALIKKELLLTGVPELAKVSVDTVERYQGSERDVIIYSFCVNFKHQLNFISNIIEENGVQIDRKLNVALTRARKQMIITGVREVLNCNPIFSRLINNLKINKIEIDN